MEDKIDSYCQMLEIMRDELNIHEIVFNFGKDDNNKQIELVWDGTWLHWRHGCETKAIKDSDGVGKILEQVFKDSKK